MVVPIERCPHLLAVIRAVAHEVVVDVVAHEHDAVDDVTRLPHLALDLAAGVDQASQDDGIDHVDPLSAPSPVEVVKQHPHRFLAMQIV